MKKTLVLLMTLALMLCLFAVTASAQVYDDYGVKLTIPDSFELVEDEDDEGFYFAATDGTSEFIYTPLPNIQGIDFADISASDFEEFASAALALFEEAIFSETVYNKVNCGGNQGYSVDAKIEVMGESVTTRYYYFTTEKAMFMFVYISYNDDISAVEDIMSTLVLDESFDAGESILEGLDEEYDYGLAYDEEYLEENVGDYIYEIDEIKEEMKEEYGVSISFPDKDELSISAFDYDDAYNVSILDEDYEYEFDINVYSNDDDYSFINLSSRELKDLESGFLEENGYAMEAEAEPFELNGFKGVKLEGAPYDFEGYNCVDYCYCFSTEDFYYTFWVYTWNEEDIRLHENQLSAITIEGTPFEQKIDDTLPASEFSQDGFSMTVPGFIIEDKEWAEENGCTAEWMNEAGDLEVILTISDNEVEGEEGAKYTYVGYSEEDFKAIFEDAYADDDYITDKYTGENVEINGFKGVKLTCIYEDEDGEYEGIFYHFSTEDKYYYIDIYNLNDSGKYDEYIERMVQSIEIEGKAFGDVSASPAIIFVAGLGLLIVIVIIVTRKGKKKKNAPQTSDFSQYNNPQPPMNNFAAPTQNAPQPPVNNYAAPQAYQPQGNPQPDAPKFDPYTGQPYGSAAPQSSAPNPAGAVQAAYPQSNNFNQGAGFTGSQTPVADGFNNNAAPAAPINQQNTVFPAGSPSEYNGMDNGIQ